MRLHRRLGVFGAVHAAVIVVVGVTVALRSTARVIHLCAANTSRGGVLHR
ncbi:MAG TPA: hypothetical protein VN085_00155 [Vicinamibacterales bacterium]|nr:hypothetical protein [Vicinamibacterales bacterium]